MDGLLIGPATRKQALFAGACALAIVLVLTLAAPHAREPWPAIAPFMPMCALTVFTTAVIAAFLLAARFAATRLPMLGALGGAYAFTAITVALQLLMFPGVFARTGLFGAGPYSATWMWVFWHGGFPLCVIAAVSIRDRVPVIAGARGRPAAWGWFLIGGPAFIGLALGMLALDARLAPPFHLAADANGLTDNPVGLVLCALNVAAMVVVLAKGRLRSVLDLWIAVALLASLVDAALNTLSVERFTLGWYVARAFSMLAPGVLVCVLVWEVSTLYRQLSEAHASLLQSSSRDALTRVYNRSFFDAQLRHEFERARRTGEPLSLIMIDVDHFKHYNDTFGHLHGDACLGAVANALVATLRRPGDFVARYGGEEFALVLPNTGPHDAGSLAERAREAVAQLGLPSPTPGGTLTVSAGCATSYLDVPASPGELIAAADVALYAAKRAGRNRVQIA